ncbi:immunity repressor protein [Lysinibacillus sp. B2A1]|nr:immunity repressor protein [Lysinibacillus sp. B2A1]
MNEFGDYIKNIRESKNMTLNQVALYAEISAAQLSRIETGKRGTPKPQTIEKIARALKVDYTELMEIAGYLETDTTTDYVSDNKSTYYVSRLTEKDEHDIGKLLKKFSEDIEHSDALAFDGEPLSEEAKESLIESMEHIYRTTQRINKKYTPNKYK